MFLELDWYVELENGVSFGLVRPSKFCVKNGEKCVKKLTVQQISVKKCFVFFLLPFSFCLLSHNN